MQQLIVVGTNFSCSKSLSSQSNSFQSWYACADIQDVGLQSLRTPSPRHSPTLTPRQSRKKERRQRVPYHKLFAFADRVDIVLMVAGGVAAVAHGCAVPVFFIFFSRLINDLGHSFGDLKKQSQEVSEVSNGGFQVYMHNSKFHCKHIF